MNEKTLGLLEAGGWGGSPPVNPCDLHFLHCRLFSKWQRTSSLTWVSALSSSMPCCGVGVGGWSFGEEREESLASVLQPVLTTAPDSSPSHR